MSLQSGIYVVLSGFSQSPIKNFHTTTGICFTTLYLHVTSHCRCHLTAMVMLPTQWAIKWSLWWFSERCKCCCHMNEHPETMSRNVYWHVAIKEVLGVEGIWSIQFHVSSISPCIIWLSKADLKMTCLYFWHCFLLQWLRNPTTTYMYYIFGSNTT